MGVCSCVCACVWVWVCMHVCECVCACAGFQAVVEEQKCGQCYVSKRRRISWHFRESRERPRRRQTQESGRNSGRCAWGPVPPRHERREDASPVGLGSDASPKVSEFLQLPSGFPCIHTTSSLNTRKKQLMRLKNISMFVFWERDWGWGAN